MDPSHTDSKPDETDVITVRYWASARSASGVDGEVIEVTGPTTLADLRQRLAERHPGGRLTAVLDACSVLVGDRPVSTEDPDDVVIEPGQSVEFLPPFAGG